LLGDPTRLGQVLLNLLGNAIKFTEAGEVAIQILLCEQAAEQVKLEFSVHDTGIGMNDETLAHLFEPFTQADNSTSRNYGGSGLGLTISQRLVQMMGAEISVESQPGKGSVFTFALAFGYRGAEQVETQAALLELGLQQVLLVDDNPAALAALQSALEFHSCQVTVVHSAEAALERLAKPARFADLLGNSQIEAPIDLVFMDYTLPGNLNGLQVIQRLKDDAQLTHIPAILTISAEEFVRLEETVQLDGYLIKPFTNSQLLETMQQVRGQKNPQLTLPGTRPVSPDILKNLRGGHILLVEDNEINQDVAMEMLQNMGLRVSLASNGKAALERVASEHFDAVLMDIQMPGMDGYQVTARIRQDPRYSAAQLPIIAMTAHALESDRRKSLEAGLSDYISKPVDVTNLANVLLRWVHPEPAQAESVAATIIQASDDAHALPEVEDHPEYLPQDPVGSKRDELPAALDSLDMVGALARLGDNKVLYRRMLLMFHAEHEQDVQAIRSALESNDLELARRLAHTLKGLAGSVGADELGAVAKQLESAIAQVNEPVYEDLLAQVEEKLAVVMVAVARLL
jgi:CheY-like chemotaxis protein/anti-sigma regulatory factor (Ser/Thr protein kinase)